MTSAMKSAIIRDTPSAMKSDTPSMLLASPRRILTAALPLLCAGLAAAGVGSAQSVPVRTGSPLYSGFQIPRLPGSLHYAISASERAELGYNGSNQTSTSAVISGDLGFITSSVTRPFSLIYSGGYLLNTSGQPSAVFQNLSVEQNFKFRKWRVDLADHVQYTPGTPSVGLSGITGIGDLGEAGSVGGSSSQGILTPFVTRVVNGESIDAVRAFTGKTSGQVSASFSQDRFLHYSGGIQSNSYAYSGAVLHRISARSSCTVQGGYSTFSYVQIDGSFTAEGATATCTHQVTRRLGVSGGGGPERIGGSPLTGAAASLTYSAQAGLTYAGGGSSGLSTGFFYSRATTAGSGVTYGALVDSVGFFGTRNLTRSMQLSSQVAYSKNTGLAVLTVGPTLDSEGVTGSLQANRALTRTISVFFSYSAQHQSFSGTVQGQTPLNGVTQTLGFGFTYSPTAIALGRQQ